MTDEQKQKYVETMKLKAFAYAENALSDVKALVPKDEYQETAMQFAQAFLSGGDAAIATLREITNSNEG